VADPEIKEPSSHLTIPYNGEERELFMSFLRLNSILRFIEDPNRVILMTIDPDLVENVLRILLAPKGGAGEMFNFELDEEAIPMEDVDKVLNWAQDHLTYFFMKRFQEVAVKAAQLEPIAKRLQSSLPGSEASSSETASAGPSAQSQAA